MQQQQQSADYDLLAVFPDESQAVAATTKLHKEGFDENEVYQITASTYGSGVYREHGPNSARRDYFLQTQRARPNPLIVVLCAIVAAVIVSGLTFATTFAVPSLPEPTTLLVGAAIGIVLGIIIGLLQRGRVRGAIGQKQPQAPPQKQLTNARTVVALRFADPANISRKSRARAILLNNQGKIDRSIKRLE